MAIPQMIKDVLKVYLNYHPNSDTSEIIKAFELAKEKHTGQKRDSGEQYITHPVEVTNILAELGATSDVLIAGLLHDVVEDTSYKLDDIKKEFGNSVALMVDGVTKLEELDYGKNAKAETVRKLVVAMSKDIRVLMIKVADRLHNMRTLEGVNKEKRIKKATETLDVYAPLANRLGLGKIKSELEELSFKSLEPEKYDAICNYVNDNASKRVEKIKIAEKELKKRLKELNVNAEIKGREKEYYSIYLKMTKRNMSLNEIHDLIGIRVIVETVPDCYAVLGSVHGIWNPISGRFKDYIARPKMNMYQSLHTTVIGPDNQSIEIQIRTYEMNEKAELGIAAHWKYKESLDTQKNKGEKRIINAEKVKSDELMWVKNIAEWQKETENSEDFLDELKFQIKTQEIYVYTPAGDIVTLPEKSVPIDLAYAIHTKVGENTVGARVNGKMVPISYVLKTGDTVEIITSSSDSKPNRDWLDFVQSAKARQKIKQFFKKESRQNSLEIGKRKVNDELKKRNIPSKTISDNIEIFQNVANDFGLSTIDSLFMSIGQNDISSENAINKFTQLLTPELDENDPVDDVASKTELFEKISTDSSDKGILVDSQKGFLVKLAQCCTPVPGDKIIGFLTQTQGVSVHNVNCKNARHLEITRKERVVNVEWMTTQNTNYSVNLKLETMSKSGLLNEISTVFKEKKVDIISLNSRETKENINIIELKVIVGGNRMIQELISELKKIDSVYSVERVSY